MTALKNYGLSENEAKIYKTLLELLEAPVYKISKIAEVPRTTTYACLENLKKQGLILSFHKNNILYYTPESSQKLLEILDNKKESITKILPQLDALIHSSSIKPIIKIYEGPEGIKKVRQDQLETLVKEDQKILYAIANADMYKILPKYFSNWVEERVKHKIQSWLIMPHSAQDNQKYADPQKLKQDMRQVKFLPQGFDYQCSLNIYGNKLAFFSLKKGQIISVILESQPITNMFKQFFLFNWGMLK